MPRVVKRSRVSKRRTPVYSRIRGRGGYYSDYVRPALSAAASFARPYTKGKLGQMGSTLGSSIGKAIGAPRPMRKYMANAGKKIGDYLGEITGLGEYKMKRNNLLDMTAHSVPFMHSAKDGVRIRHREFITDVSSSTSFANQSFSINPGLSSSFPWLAAIAQNFEEYSFDGLAVEFVSTSADALNSTNTALGTVIIAAEYNTAQDPYINKQQMENAMWAVSGRPSNSLCMPIECAPHLNPMGNQYVRTASVPSGQDIRLYDLCNVQFATVGSQAAAVIGELWLTYDVVLLKPQLSSGLNLAGESAHYQLIAPVVNSAAFGATRIEKFDSIGLEFGADTVTFPLGAQGNYSLFYDCIGVSGSTAGFTLAYTNCTENKILAGDSANAVQNTGTAPILIHQVYITIADPNKQAVVQFASGTLPATITSADFVVAQLNGNLDS